MFRRLLIANRGEIAVRVIRAAHDLGIQAVAVHTPVDTDSRHARMADDAIPLPDNRSYLDPDALVKAAIRSGAEAIHPGYGFLSEDPLFAEACRSAGVTFIGPPADAIRLMGQKAQARAAMQQAGVPILPGSGLLASVQDAERAANSMEYPVFIKASAGGGGRGMRLVERPDDLGRLLALAQREARSAFGDDSVYLERYLPGARHVEIQVIADHHGNVVYAGERECSVQRRSQKIMEEAPSPAVGVALREEMGTAACRAAAAAGYRGAGTVEFLLDQREYFYFLEMNTRIQVEHPVTEMVTGIDIVREQLRIAAGQPLSFGQQDVALRGHAIECRILAEDPAAGFLPCPGAITRFVPPEGPWVRVDTGVATGTEVSPFYDSLVAKVIVWGEDRASALARMRRALAEFSIEGIRTNLPLQRSLVEHEDVRRGALDTGWLERQLRSEHPLGGSASNMASDRRRSDSSTAN